MRLANFGFAVTGDSPSNADEDAAAEDLASAAQRDCRALGGALAELIFSALSREGPTPRTGADALRRTFVDVFARDWAAVAAFCGEEPAWAPACGLLAASGGAGWALLAALFDDDTYSADADGVLAAAAALEDAVRVE